MTNITREEWLEAAASELDALFFKGKGHTLPDKLRVSVGWPLRSSKAIGQCFDPSVSGDGATEMFVSPALGEDVIKVLATLLHEMIHAAVGIECKHRGAFRKLAKEVGLAGKMKSTFAEECTKLHGQLFDLSEELGAYPHAPLGKPEKKGKAKRPKVRIVSVKDPDYKFSVYADLIEDHGLPSDPWGEEMKLG